MAEKINIADLKIAYFGDKTVRRYIETIADADSTLRLGSIAAVTAGEAAAMALRAIRLTGTEDEALKKAETDCETLRDYFVKIIDEDTKARKPLEKRLAAGASEKEIESGYLTACIMIDELMYSSIQMMELLGRVADKIAPTAAVYAAAAVRYARTAMDSVRLVHAVYGARIVDEVSSHTVTREPEIAMDGNAEFAETLMKKFESVIR